MSVSDFTANMTAMGTSFVGIAMDAGAKAVSTEPYSYIIAGALAVGAIALGLSFLLKRKGRKGRK